MEKNKKFRVVVFANGFKHVRYSDLSAEDFEHLQELACYLLSIKADKYVSPFSGEEYFINSEPVAFSVEDFALLKKLKHLHVLSYDKK